MTKNQILSATSDDIRTFAHHQLETLGWTYTGNLLADLYRHITFDSEVGIDAPYREMNFTLDIKGCVGRAAMIGAFVEKHTTASLMAGDVIVDYFRELLGKNKDKIANVPGYMEEVIMYEDPHIVPIIDGKQFEPLSILMEETVVHPRVESYPFWEAIHSAMLCSLALMPVDMPVKVEALKKAARSGRSMEVLYAEGQVALEQGNAGLFLEKAKEILSKKKSARSMYLCYYMFTMYESELKNEYSVRVFDYFKDFFKE